MIQRNTLIALSVLLVVAASLHTLAPPGKAMAQVASTTEPIISGVVTSPTSDGTGAMISWNTDVLANGQVAYGTTTNYGTFSPLTDSLGTTSHSALITGLIPSTMYHFMLLSMGIGSTTTTASSSDMTFTTGAATTTATTTQSSIPVITNISASSTNDGTGAIITWDTNVLSSSQVQYGTTTSYGIFSALFDAAGGTTAHSIQLAGLTPGTLYHYRVTSLGASTTNATGTAMSMDQTLMTASTSATSTGTTATSTNATSTSQTGNNTNTNTNVNNNTSTSTTSNTNTNNNTNVNNNNSNTNTNTNNNTSNTTSGTNTTTTNTATTTLDLATLQQEIQDLQNRVGSLEGQVSSLWSFISQHGWMMGSTTTSSTTQQTAAAYIDQQGRTFRAGDVIDFGGHNFLHEEQVTVRSGGVFITTAHADGGGNFSTGSLRLPPTAGTYTYTFSGAQGDSAQATITVQ